ncbi:unnamed protein product [Colias eurytheme]|nr:unnamed protein product [Colias eurytheme]
MVLYKVTIILSLCVGALHSGCDVCDADVEPYEPVCGSDNLTYPSRCCFLCLSPLFKIKKLGECEAPPKPGDDDFCDPFKY